MTHCWLLGLVLCGAPPEMELRLLDGATVHGTPIEMSVERISLTTPAGRADFDTERVFGLFAKDKPAPAAQKPAVWVELVDGAALLATDYTVKDRKATIALCDGGPLEVATRDIAAVRLQPGSETADKEWARIQNMKLDGDVLVVRKDDAIDYHKGVLGDVDDKTVGLDLDGEKIPVKRAKVHGLIYYHAANRDLPGAICVLADAAGMRWPVRTLALNEKQELEWTTPCGLKVVRPLAAVAAVDFSGGKVIYLSDLKPDSVQWAPFFGTAQQLPSVAEFYAPRMDQNLSSKPLQLDKTRYPKGVSLHSRTELVYRLPGRFSRFKAIAGIDDEVAPNGHVRLVIRGDDQVLFDGPIAGGDKPKSLDLDIGGVKRLTILVDFGEKLDVGDHLDLCLARISK
jgi:hypothetical protein